MAVALSLAALSVGVAITYPHNAVPTSPAAMSSLFPASPAALHDQRHTVVRMAVATHNGMATFESAGVSGPAD